MLLQNLGTKLRNSLVMGEFFSFFLYNKNDKKDLPLSIIAYFLAIVIQMHYICMQELKSE